MKQKTLLKMVVLAMLVAFGVVISPLLRVEGMCPMAHFINILCSVLLGPWYSLLCATLIGVIRMTVMGIPPLALTGAVFGAFLSGVLYRISKGKIFFAVLGEIIGTGIIGAIVSYPVMTYIVGKEGLSWLFYVPSFVMGTLIGGSIAYLFLTRLAHSGMLAKFQGMLRTQKKMGDMEALGLQVREKQPLVHCIINPVAANLAANAVLAVGARPVMAEYSDEAEEITATAQALVLNLGGISDAKIKAMHISGRTAKEKGIPSVLDLVGVACSKLRRDVAHELIEEACPAIIKGNYSEIQAMAHTDYQAAGVDAEQGLNTDAVIASAIELAKQYNTTILATGKTDIVTDGVKLYLLNNGVLQLASVTGTGCMLGALCGCYLTEGDGLRAAIAAAATLGICGELAQTQKGNGSFIMRLMNRLSTLTEPESYIKMEEREVESI